MRVIEDGDRVSGVARDFRVSTPTVRKWLDRYRTRGAAGLIDASSRPRHIPTRLLQPGEVLRDALMQLLHSPPADHGLNRASWRLKDLKTVLDKKGLVATPQNIRKEIASSGVRWRQARIALTSSDPEYRVKLAAIQSVLQRLRSDEAFFSIDELGPVAVKMRGGKSLQLQGTVRIVPQWQKSRGALILTAALELSHNRVTYFFSDKKNSVETIRLIDRLRSDYAKYRTLFLSWDAAPWHDSAQLRAHLEAINENATADNRPIVRVLPLPKSSQFLNVVESVFSGMARAILHNSNYASLDEARSAVAGYLDERNRAFESAGKRAGKKIWGKELVPSAFNEANNCKDARWLG